MDGTDIQEILERVSQTLDGLGFDLVAVVSALIAVLGAIFSFRETRRQRKIALEGLRQSLDRASLEWGKSVIAVLSEVEIFIAQGAKTLADTAFTTRRNVLMARLSSLVDEGRLYFPNIDVDSHGAEKDGAYQGKRPPILDAVIYAYYELNDLTARTSEDLDSSKEFINQCRRLLVSELQAHLDPRTRNTVVERYNHRLDDQREDALYRAGKLGLDLNNRRHGILTRFDDDGWTSYAQTRDRDIANKT